MCACVQCQLGDGVVIAALYVGDETLAAVGGPAHRALQPARSPYHQRLLRMQEDFHAEGATDVARDHAQLFLADSEDNFGQLAVNDVRSLARGVERGAPARAVEIRQRRSRL